MRTRRGAAATTTIFLAAVVGQAAARGLVLRTTTAAAAPAISRCRDPSPLSRLWLSTSSSSSDPAAAWDAEDAEWAKRSSSRRRRRGRDFLETSEDEPQPQAEKLVVDEEGVMRTTLLWALLHGPFTASALPTVLALGLATAGGGGGGKGLFGSVSNLFRRGAVKETQPSPSRRSSSSTGDDGDNFCPCGSGNSYQTCCYRLHCGERVATSATELLRARYSAYSKCVPQFLMGSTLRGSDEWRWDQEAWSGELEEFSGSHEFLRLEYGPEKKVKKKGVSIIIFTAFLKSLGKGGGKFYFTEKSYFVEEDGAWFWSHGDLIGQGVGDTKS